jgi:hypothetical protein
VIEVSSALGCREVIWLIDGKIQLLRTEMRV